jgi:hypothetical protein
MASLPHGIQHVDRNALYTDLGARVAYLKEFIEFGPGISLGANLYDRYLQPCR